jgi:DNA helicase HerA-like ATPase
MPFPIAEPTDRRKANPNAALAGSREADDASLAETLLTIGYVLLDSFSNEDDLIPILTDQNTARAIARRRYVLIEETGERRKKYFAQIAKGPLHTPEWGSASEGQNVFPIVKGDEIEYVPSFHSYYLTKVLGEIVETIDESSQKPVRLLQTAFTRPLPKSRVSYIPQNELYSLLNLVSGQTPIGILANYGTDDPVPFYINDRLVNRQLGIFGSTGSGKSNTVIALAETLLEKGWCVIIFDHSGEYYRMTDPSEEAGLFSEVWTRLDIRPKGIDGGKFQRFIPVVDDRKDPKAIRFGVSSEGIPFALIKALMSPLSDAQDRVIYQIYRDLRSAQAYNGLPSLVTKVQQIPDAPRDKNEPQADQRWQSKPILAQKLQRLTELGIFDVQTSNNDPGEPSDLWANGPNQAEQIREKASLTRKRINLSAEELIKKGRLAVVDLGNVGEQDVINIIGVAVLDMLERAKNRIGSAYKDIKVAVFLEEAHTFFSSEHAGRPEFAETLTRITKRIFKVGRKFWLNPVVISQQPADIPAGIMSQCVMRIVHQLSDERDIVIVGKGSAKQFSDIIPDLRKGECLVTTPEILAPQVVRIRPAMAKKVDPQTDNG